MVAEAPALQHSYMPRRRSEKTKDWVFPEGVWCGSSRLSSQTYSGPRPLLEPAQLGGSFLPEHRLPMISTIHDLTFASQSAFNPKTDLYDLGGL